MSRITRHCSQLSALCRIFRTMSDFTINPVNTFIAYSRLLENHTLDEGCAGQHHHNSATGELTPVLLCSVCGQERAVDEFFTTRNVVEVPTMVGESLLMTMSEVGIAPKASSTQLDEAVFLHRDDVYEVGDDRDAVRAEQIWYLQDLTDQSAD